MIEHGAYNLLMDAYYGDGKPIAKPMANPMAEAMQIAKAITPDEQKAVERVIRDFFQDCGDCYRHTRIEHELEISNLRSKSGKAGADARWQTDGKGNGKTDGKQHGKTMPPQPQPQPQPQGTTTLLRKVVETDVSSCPHLQIIDAYHRILPMGRRVNQKLWNGTRAKYLQARWKDSMKFWTHDVQGLDWWEQFFEHCAKSRFLTGKVPPRQPGDQPFEVSLDFLVEQRNFVKCMEGHFNR